MKKGDVIKCQFENGNEIVRYEKIIDDIFENGSYLYSCRTTEYIEIVHATNNAIPDRFKNMPVENFKVGRIVLFNV